MPPVFQSGRCSDDEIAWDDVPPQSSQGMYFVGVSLVMDSEAAARDDAMQRARASAVRWQGEQVAYEASSSAAYAGAGSGVSTSVRGEATLKASAEGVASYVKDVAYCQQDVVRPDGGFDHRVRVLAFLPRVVGL